VTTAANSPLLEVKDLETKFFGAGREFTAVDKISFNLNRGEFLAVVGESGSGKSVTALSVLRLMPPQGRITGGQVIFDGEDLLHLPGHALRQVRGNRIAMIFQEPMTSLNPVLTIGDQIVEALVVHKMMGRSAAREQAIELLRRVQIPLPEKRIDDYPHRLSGGMRQRVMIAMALSCEPDILIADEPTTALDVTVQAQILDLLKRLQAEYQMAMILITHDLGIVRDCADRVVVMYGGKIVEQGRVADTLAATAHPYTQMLVDIARNLEGESHRALKRNAWAPFQQKNQWTGCNFYDRCPEHVAACRDNEPPQVQLTREHCVWCFNRASAPARGRNGRLYSS